MTAHHRIACQDLHLTDRGDSGEPHSAQTLDSRVVEDHAFVGRRRETQSVDFVVGGELQTVDAIGERDRGAIVLTEESLTRSEADGRSISSSPSTMTGGRRHRGVGVTTSFGGTTRLRASAVHVGR